MGSKLPKFVHATLCAMVPDSLDRASCALCKISNRVRKTSRVSFHVRLQVLSSSVTRTDASKLRRTKPNPFLLAQRKAEPCTGLVSPVRNLVKIHRRAGSQDQSYPISPPMLNLKRCMTKP